NVVKRIYKTGDLARFLPDGNIEYIGRLDNQVKIRGYRIELGEIEAQLNKIDGIIQAAVKVQEDGSNIKRLVAYFVTKNPIDQNLASDIFDDWKDILKRQLPDYMIPFEFVELKEMPFTNSGKIDHQALPPVPKFAAQSSRKIKFPTTETEKE